jgi:hypothetical protein
MPKITLTAPIAKFHGTIGDTASGAGTVAYSIGAAMYGRRWTVPTNPDSLHQVAVRAYMAAAAQALKGLSAVNVADWKAKYPTVLRRNILGAQYSMSWANSFCLVNAYRQIDGQAIVTTAPTKVLPGVITGITSATINGSDIEIIVTHTLNTGDFLFARLTPPLPGAARKARVGDYRTITNSMADSIVVKGPSPQTLTLAMEQFSLIADDYIGVEIKPLSPMYYPGNAFFHPSTKVLGV